jgi:hypothetical protein
MGWIPATAYRIGHGAVSSPIKVDEPAGFTGERVTPSDQTPSKAFPLFTVPRNNRTVYATKREATREGDER